MSMRNIKQFPVKRKVFVLDRNANRIYHAIVQLSGKNQVHVMIEDIGIQKERAVFFLNKKCAGGYLGKKGQEHLILYASDLDAKSYPIHKECVDFLKGKDFRPEELSTWTLSRIIDTIRLDSSIKGKDINLPKTYVDHDFWEGDNK